jgi:hypothetical protein
MQFAYITTLTIFGNGKKVLIDPLIDTFKIKLFQQLQHVYITNMNIADIKILLNLTRNLQSLHCENTYCTDANGVNLRIFSKMQYLKSLKLSFAENYNLSVYYRFDITGNPSKRSILPSKLETFSLQGIYDTEEHLVNPDYTAIIASLNNINTDLVWQHPVITNWSRLEEELVRKYSMLASLTNLKSLTLGRVSSFTSRVWRECLMPYGSQLEYLTMKNWPGSGQRESPQTLINKRQQQQQQGQVTTTTVAADESERIIDGIEAAISEYITCLTNIKQVHLDDFVCGVGLIDGISKLDKTHYIQVEGLEKEKFSVNDFKGIKLFGFKIVMNSGGSRASVT